MEREQGKQQAEDSLPQLLWLDVKIAGAAALEVISYIGYAAGGGGGGRYHEDSRLQELLRQRQQLKAASSPRHF